ncbi:transmembrane protein, putative (macronuclear) [Tetrahymena thermophila SB210]|uniref:Transmembrane protein, putative n=1 Tax=Tetrahymena thermophila (strain SB210) TaxID=312017 RepID=I7M879_TETTS|nr:transmembrane protein, putative [Tetrahymena thermophila SB210]EAR97334.2 transmembrane protein, putative [Tetrahymena thermophila SB210]|eukprot:XP_001017579.2 transmembrane protein, putative [Tetrahymena thermophila SB210]
MTAIEFTIDFLVNLSLFCLILCNKIQRLIRFHHYAFLINQVVMVAVTFYNVMSQQNYESQEYSAEFQYFYLGAILYGLVLGYSFLYRLAILMITTFLYLGLALSDSKNQKPLIAVIILSNLVLYLNKTYQDEKEKRLFYIANQRISFWNNIIQNVLPINMIVVKYDEEFSRVKLETSNCMTQKNLGIIDDESLQDFLEKTKLEVQTKTSSTHNSESTLLTNGNSPYYNSKIQTSGLQQMQIQRTLSKYKVKQSQSLSQPDPHIFQTPTLKPQTTFNQQQPTQTFRQSLTNSPQQKQQVVHSQAKQLTLKQLVKEEILLKIKNQKNSQSEAEKDRFNSQRHSFINQNNDNRYQTYNGEYQKSINSEIQKFGLRIYTFTMIGYYALICFENESYKEKYSNSKTKFKVLKYLFRCTITKSIKKLITQNEMIDQFLSSFESFKKITFQKSQQLTQKQSTFNTPHENQNQHTPAQKQNQFETQQSYHNNTTNYDIPSLTHLNKDFKNNLNTKNIFMSENNFDDTIAQNNIIQNGDHTKSAFNIDNINKDKSNNSNKLSNSIIVKPQEFLTHLKDQIQEIQLNFSNIMHLFGQKKRTEYIISEISIQDFLKRIQQKFKNQFKRQKINFTHTVITSFDEQKDLILKQDERRLFQIINNLIYNAIEYNNYNFTSDDHRFIKIEVTSTQSEPNHLNIKITNSTQFLRENQLQQENSLFSEPNCLYLSTRNDLMLKFYKIYNQFKIGLRTTRKLVKQIGPFDDLKLMRTSEECIVSFTIYKNIEILKKDVQITLGSNLKNQIQHNINISANNQITLANNILNYQSHSTENQFISTKQTSKIFSNNRNEIIQLDKNLHLGDNSLTSQDYIQELRNLSEFNSALDFNNFKTKQNLFNEDNLINLKKIHQSVS